MARRPPVVGSSNVARRSPLVLPLLLLSLPVTLAALFAWPFLLLGSFIPVLGLFSFSSLLSCTITILVALPVTVHLLFSQNRLPERRSWIPLTLPFLPVFSPTLSAPVHLTLSTLRILSDLYRSSLVSLYFDSISKRILILGGSDSARILRENIVYLASRDPLREPSKRLDVYYASPSDSTATDDLVPTILLLSGPTYRLMSSKSFPASQIALRLRRLGYCVVVPSLTSFPDATMLDMVYETREVLRWIKDEVRAYGGDKSKVWIIGHGSGAHLALLSVVQSAVVSTRDQAIEKAREVERERKRMEARVAADSDDGNFESNPESALSNDPFSVPPQPRSTPRSAEEPYFRTTTHHRPTSMQTALHSDDDETSNFSTTESSSALEDRGQGGDIVDSLNLPSGVLACQVFAGPENGTTTDQPEDEGETLSNWDGLRVRGMVLIGGTYDVVKQLKVEKEMGLGHVSSLKRVCGPAKTDAELASPCHLLYASSTLLPRSRSSLPSKFLLIHGGKDSSVPYSQSVLLKNLLVGSAGIGSDNVRLRLYREETGLGSLASLMHSTRYSPLVMDEIRRIISSDLSGDDDGPEDRKKRSPRGRTVKSSLRNSPSRLRLELLLSPHTSTRDPHQRHQAPSATSTIFVDSRIMTEKEDYGGWVPKDSESPAEREKRIKREKRAAKLAELNGTAGAGAGGLTNGYGYDERQHQSGGYGRSNATGFGHGTRSGEAAPASVPDFAKKRAEAIDGWQPAEGESPAEREKRIKKEKRAAYLASQGQGPAPPSTSSASNGNYYPPPSTEPSGPPPTLAEGGTRAIHPSRLAASDALARETGDKKGKNTQSMTPARAKYLLRKKQRAKGRKAAAPKSGKGGVGEDGASGEGSVAGSASAVGGKRKRGDDDDEEGDGDASDAGTVDGKGDDKYAGLTAEEKEAKIKKIAELKAARKEARLAKKAELRRIKAEGGVVPPPKRRTAPKQPSKLSTVVKAPTPEPEPEQPAEPTEEELERRKEREEIEARKIAKRQKREQRRLAEADKAKISEPVAEDVEMSTLIPTSHPVDSSRDRFATPPTDMPTLTSGPSDVPVADAAASAGEPAPLSPPAALLRLPSATRPAPPSAKTLSTLNIHESVREKQVVDPTRKVKIGETAQDDGVGVAERGRKRLRGDMGVEEWFAVQTAVLPILLPSTSRAPALYSPFDPPRDICVSAPTGSGKTLSYVVPIVETLQHRVVTRLRALVLLPTRDLVGQVRETFEAFAKGTGLKIGVATGQHSFAHEQSVLVGDNLPESLEGGSSQVDILIATPGRLIDHLKSTNGFSLQHLRFLVVDEADRLLTQSFHDWLPTILDALKPASTLSTSLADERAPPRRADAMAPVWWDADGKVGRVASDVDERSVSSCQKLLFSATLSRDPAKIDALHLHRPIYISVEDALDPHAEDEQMDNELKFTFPAELSEHMIISPSTHKPLYLFHLLHTLSITSALCFTKSVEAATRLAKLVEFFEAARSPEGGEQKKVVVKAYSSDLAPGERKKVLKEFKAGEIQMLICSDLISRGIDIPNVSHVISYDVPTDMRKYVHRVGRTARAGQKGEAWSLVEDQEVAPFKAIMSSAQHYQKIDRLRVKDKLVEPFVPAYQVALDKLRAFFSTTGREREP
ncbi:hypothetical protein JCM10212_006170 [Sporobolomyces blumeae]